MRYTGPRNAFLKEGGQMDSPDEDQKIIISENNIIKKNCKFCSKSFIPKRAWQKFCKSKCRTAYFRWKLTRNIIYDDNS